MLSNDLRLDHRQSPTLTPRLQQAVRLLQLSSMEFTQTVRDALSRNPFLEEESTTAAEDDAPKEAPAAPRMDDPVPAPADTASPDGSDVIVVSSDSADMGWELPEFWTVGNSGDRHGSSSDSELSVVERAPADLGLRAHLHAQINLKPLSPRDRALVGCVIESLDDDGYLRTPLEELVTLAEMEPAVDLSEMSMALKLVQTLEPSGVGARSVAECLSLQLNVIENEALRALAREVIDEHLERLAQRDLGALARAMNRTPEELEAVRERIRHLDPRPGWRYGSTGMQFVTPDVLVRKVKGRWMTALNPAILPRVRLNQTYVDLFQRHRDAKHSELAAHLQEARWTVRNVERRFSTILSVTQAILRRQARFLEYGPLAMKPLGLREIAEEVGMHESTVSRVTNNKYMATPVGVFELKYFFSRAMPTAAGGACSATAIRGLIREMIDAEDATRPLSDADIARLLARQGLTVARRTVTKYRQQLRVEAVERRRSP